MISPTDDVSADERRDRASTIPTRVLGPFAHGEQLPRILRWLPSAVMLLLLVGAGMAPTGAGARLDSSPASWIPVLLIAVAVCLRKPFPRSSAIAGVVVATVGILAGGPVLAYLIGLFFLMFSASTRTDRRTAWILAAATVVVVGTAGVLVLDGRFGGFQGLLQLTAMIGFATAAGDARRNGAAYIASITERAQRAEATKEAEARRRVAEERLRIARDLHDVLAHQIAVINLHAGVASQALPARPEVAEGSLGIIRQASREVLSELGSLLTVLRAEDAGGEEHRVPAVPVRGVKDLDSLVEHFGANGLRVDLRREGTPSELDEVVDITAFLVIQEALTNAHKHGDDATALLQLEYGDHLEITVINTTDLGRRTDDARFDDGGHGLLGIRERLAAVGGSVRAAAGPGPVFRFVASMPFHAITQADVDGGPR